MRSKEEYRSYFADVSNYVKMKSILLDLGLTTANFYRFMKGSDFNYCLSIDKLDMIEKQVVDTLSKFT